MTLCATCGHLRKHCKPSGCLHAEESLRGWRGGRLCPCRTNPTRAKALRKARTALMSNATMLRR